MNQKNGINTWSEDSRPRERLLRHGASTLSTAELLAILIGSGTAKKDAIALMTEVMNYCHNDLTRLARISFEELTHFQGIGQAKAITILSALELARRRMEAGPGERLQLNSPQALYHFLRPKMCDKRVEVFWVVLLDNQLNLIDDRQIGQGSDTHTSVEIREIFRYIVSRDAVAFVMAHNHPSGNPTPSEADIRLTQRIAAVAKELNVRLIDHIVISDGKDNFFSFAQDKKSNLVN